MDKEKDKAVKSRTLEEELLARYMKRSLAGRAAAALGAMAVAGLMGYLGVKRK